MLRSIVRTRVANALRSRLLVPAVVALAATVGGVGYGMVNDDVVTAAGSLVFLPSALLLFAIATRDGIDESTNGPEAGNDASTDAPK